MRRAWIGPRGALWLLLARLAPAGVALGCVPPERQPTIGTGVTARPPPAAPGVGVSPTPSESIRGFVRVEPRSVTIDSSTGGVEEAEGRAIRMVVLSHLREVQQCYEPELLHDRTLRGKVVLAWSIDANGTVRAAKVVKSTLPGDAVATCILNAVRGWPFRPPQGAPTRVVYPFVFGTIPDSAVDEQRR